LLAVEMKYSRENVDAAKASLAPGATPMSIFDANFAPFRPPVEPAREALGVTRSQNPAYVSNRRLLVKL